MEKQKFIEAIEENEIETVQKFLKSGMNANVKVEDGTIFNGMTALSFACNWDHKEIVKLLLEHGADVNEVDHEGKAPLHYTRYPDLITVLIERGANVNVSDNTGLTPLMISCFLSILSSVQVLVEHGAELDVQDGNGMTALMHASRDAGKEVFNYLIEKGADQIIKDFSGSDAASHALAIPEF